MYSKPYSAKEIKKHYPELASWLLKDPVHSWRAKNGIELIHKEPTLPEQKRIWKNWLEMPKELQEISNKKSLELFGVINKEHNQRIMNEWKSHKNKK